MAIGEDWLGGDPRDPVTPEARKKIEDKAIEFAQLYRVFVDDPRAAALLQHWIETVEQRDVPPAASVQEYAYWESRRVFIRGIERQLKLAQSRG